MDSTVLDTEFTAAVRQTPRGNWKELARQPDRAEPREIGHVNFEAPVLGGEEAEVEPKVVADHHRTPESFVDVRSHSPNTGAFATSVALRW